MTLREKQCIFREISIFLVQSVPLKTNQNGRSNQFFI